MKKYAEYDRQILQKLADDLYRRADTIVFVYTAVFLAVGSLLGLVGVHFFSTTGASSVALGSSAGLLCAVAGWAVGSSEAFKLRVQAQQVLWMLQIEGLLTPSRKLG